jgi:hypothetical protein
VEILIAAGVINAQGIVESLPGWQPGTGDRPGQAPFDNIKLDIRNFRGGGGLGGFGGLGVGLGFPPIPWTPDGPVKKPF